MSRLVLTIVVLVAQPFLIKIVRISDGKLGKIGAVLTYSICYDDCAPVAVIAEAETATGSGRT
jgi:hypothetical protein